MKKIILSTIACVSLLFAAYTDNGTDYSKATINSFAYEPALAPLETVNMILGILSQTKISESKFVNKGPYQALIKLKEKKGQIRSAGSQGNSKVEKLSQITVNVTRKSDNDPIIVKFWYDAPIEDENDEEKRFLGHLTANEGVSGEYPYGKFTMHFSGYGINDDGTTNFTAKRIAGFLKVDKGNNDGEASVLYINDVNETGMSQALREGLKLTIKVNGEGAGEGEAIVKSIDFEGEGGPSVKMYALAFGENFYRVKEINTSNLTQISDKVMDKNSTSHIVYRYGVYREDNGTKLNINSGFPIVKVDSTTGKEHHGYIGYWGLWSENSAIKNGDTVYKENDRDRTTAYTIVQAPGKLKKYTKSTVAMSKLHNTKMYLWNETDKKQYIVTWDKNAGGGNGNYKILGTQNYETGEANTTSAAHNQYIFSTGGDDNRSNPIQIDNWTKVWSEALQSHLPIRADINNSTNVSFYKEEVVTPEDDLTLVNFGWEIINPDMTGIDNFAITENGSNGVIGNRYQYNAASMTLVDLNRSNKAVVINNGINLTNTHREWGASIGPLLTIDRATYYDANNFWSIEQNESVFYGWETGQNDWNKFTSIKLSGGEGTLVTFDAPIAFIYEHNATNDINGATDANGTYSLYYDGFSLQIPWKNENGNWKPKFNLKDGTKLTYDSVGYVVKRLDERVIVNEVANGINHPVLNISDALINEYTSIENNVHDADLVRGIGEKPLNTKVKVIKGKLVD